MPGGVHCLFGPAMIPAIKRSGGDGLMARRHEGSKASHIYDFLASLFSLLCVLLLDARLRSVTAARDIPRGAARVWHRKKSLPPENITLQSFSTAIKQCGHGLEGASPRPPYEVKPSVGFLILYNNPTYGGSFD